MADLPEKYRFRDGQTVLGAETFNQIFADIDLRLRRQEGMERDWLAATRDLIAVGLERINDVLLPAYERVQTLAEIGFLVAAAAPAPAISFAVGDAALVIADGDQRELFSPSPFVVLTRSTTAADWAIARRITYNRTTGVLALDVVAAHGAAGPHSDVIVAAVAGSTVAQVELLAQGQAAKVAAQAAGATATAARDTAVVAATTATTKAGQAAESATAAGASQIAAGASAAAAANSAAAALAAVGGVKVTVADTTAKTLSSAVSTDGLVTKAVTSPSGDERLLLAIDMDAMRAQLRRRVCAMALCF